MPCITHKRITHPADLGGDGLHLCDGHHYIIEDSIVDFSALPLEVMDEAVGVSWGSSAELRRCLVRGAGKLFLCGSGDADKASLEDGRTVELVECVLEDAGRRLPEVQAGMAVTLYRCLVRNWGCPTRHTVRDFGAWAHNGGSLVAVDTVFWQDGFWRPLPQMLADMANHLGQAVNDEGLAGLLKPRNWLPGVCRGLTETDTGRAYALRCWSNRWWISLGQRARGRMSDAQAHALVTALESMVARLERDLKTA